MARVNLIIDQGRTFTTLVLLNDQNGYPLNVTSYSANAQMRKHAGSATLYAMNVQLTNGQMTLSMSANATAQLADGRYIYDVNLNDPANNFTTILEGLITVKPMSGYDAYISNSSYSAPAANNPF